MLKHYVQFFYPGIFVAETSEREVKNRDIKELHIPDGCYGFIFYDQTVETSYGEELRGSKKNFSSMTYIGKCYTLEEVKEQFPEERGLIRYLERNGYKRAVKIRCGNWQGLEEGETVIEA